MTSRKELARATRSRLISIARDLFATHGYEGASLEALQRRAGISRGALYHHFASKQALFEAVLEAIEADIANTVAAAAKREIDARARLRAGSLAWLELATDPAIQRIVLLDAPSVVGWEAQRAVDERHTLALIKRHLEDLERQGRLQAGTAHALAHVFVAALNELGLYIARAGQPSAKASAAAVVDLLVDRLIAPEP